MPKRRSSVDVKLVLIAGLALGATACSDEVDVESFASVDGCVVSGLHTEAECTNAFRLAQQEHVRSAPRFEDKADCEREFGLGSCETRETAQAPIAPQGEGSSPGSTTHTSSGNSFFMPYMMGYMMGSNSNSTPVSPTPYYRTAGGINRTSSGFAFAGAASGDTVRTSPSAFSNGGTHSSVTPRGGSSSFSRPSTSTVTVRGGFGHGGAAHSSMGG